MSILLVRPKSHANECIVSYLIRVAHINGFKHLGHLLKYAGLSWKNSRAPTHQIVTGEHDIKHYFSALGLEYFKPRTIDIFNQTNSTSFTTKIFVKAPKACPQCLAENGYCSDLWSYIAYTACHKHQTMLVDYNPADGKKLSWYRSSSDESELSFSRLAPPHQKASASTLDFSKTIACLIEGKNVPRSSPNVLHGLNFSEALSIIHFIAHYQYRLQNDTRFTPGSFDNLTISKHYTRAWNSLKEWPEGFHQLLNQYIDKPMSERGFTGINKHFRDIHEKLHRQKENRGINRLRTAFDQYIEVTWPNAIQTQRLCRIFLASNERLLINTKETKEILKCRDPRIESLISQQKLTAQRFKGNTYFFRDKVEALAKLYEDNWSMEQAINEIELSRYQLKRLLDSGQIKTLQQADNQNRDWLINKMDWLNLIDSFRKASSEHMTTKGKTLSGFQKQGLSIVDVFTLLKSKKVNFQFQTNQLKPNSFKQLSNFQFKY